MLDVQEALAGLLMVSSWTSLCAGGLHTDIPQSAAFPHAILKSQEVAMDWLGGHEGKEVFVDLHVYNQFEGDKEALDILGEAVRLWKYKTPAMTSHTCLFIVHLGTRHAPDTEIAGVKTKHWQANFQVFVEETI